MILGAAPMGYAALAERRTWFVGNHIETVQFDVSSWPATVAAGVTLSSEHGVLTVSAQQVQSPGAASLQFSPAHQVRLWAD